MVYSTKHGRGYVFSDFFEISPVRVKNRTSTEIITGLFQDKEYAFAFRKQKHFSGEGSIMCVALPMKIISFENNTHCIVSFSGIESKVNIRLLPDCQIGDYVLVHAGHAIEKVNPVEAENTLEVFRQLEEEMRK